MSKDDRRGNKGFLSLTVALLFFLSGACCLVYEVAWTRMFSVVAGGTTRALTAVLVAYMGGLALGGYLGGRWIDRNPGRPVLAYGVLEGLVGVLALILSFAIPWMLPLLKVGNSFFGGHALAFDLYRFFICALVLMPPTTLMGATFPIVIRGILSRRERMGTTAGVLYAANTLGAVAGSLICGFYLISLLGLRLTTWSAAACNLLIMAVILGIPRLRKVSGEVSVSAGVGDEPSGRRSRVMLILLAGYGLSGLCAMLYQVAWVRVLSLSLSNSTYALALIFAAYIGGLALGGSVMTPLADRLRRPLLWAAGFEVLIGLSAIMVMPLFEWVTASMFNWSLDFQGDFARFHLIRFAAAFGLILVPTMAMGALLPLVVGFTRPTPRER
jgi:spermidine synthase